MRGSGGGSAGPGTATATAADRVPGARPSTLRPPSDRSLSHDPDLITADLHLDLWQAAGRDPLAVLDAKTWSSLDALLIAGDLGNKPKTRWPVIDRHQPDAWFFGHTHHPAEIRQGRTLIRNVSLGYPHEVKLGDEARVLRRGLVDLSDVRGKE